MDVSRVRVRSFSQQHAAQTILERTGADYVYFLQEIVAGDFFVSVTASFRVPYVFVAMEGMRLANDWSEPFGV